MELHSRRLAEFCAGFRYEDIPQDVLEKTKLCIVDNIGTIVGATPTENGERTAAYARALGDRPESTVLGFGFKRSAETAAFVNATLSEVFDLQDGWRFGNDHACVVIPAVLAMAEVTGAGAREQLAAIVVGYEVTNRIAHVMHPSHLGRGFLPTGTAGTCGTAAAVGRLLGFDAEKMFQAIGIAGFLLPISTAENLWDGHTIKPAHSGQAARVGIECAKMAEHGFEACPLEGSRARGRGFPEITCDQPKFERLTDRLGEHFTASDVYFKMYPCCRHSHGAAEAAMKVAINNDLHLEQIRAVSVETYALAAGLLGNRPTDVSSTMIACQFSIPYVAAASLIDRTMTTTQISRARIADPRVHDLARRVSVSENPELTAIYPNVTPTIVKAHLVDGRTVQERVDMPKGDPREPIPVPELLDKYRQLAGEVLSSDATERSLQAILSFEKLSGAGELIELLRRPDIAGGS